MLLALLATRPVRRHLRLARHRFVRIEACGAHLVYQYEVHGRTYFSNQRRFRQLSGGDEFAAKYPEEFPVAYSPANPQLAVLEPGFPSEGLWLPGVGLLALLFGLAAIVFARGALSEAPEPGRSAMMKSRKARK